jgi:hypothetical protein
MTARTTPFALVFAELAPARFPGIAQAIGDDPASAADRDRFVLLAPVGELLREVVPDDSPPESLEAYVRLLHHAYRHWAAGGWVYDVSEALLARALAGGPLSSRPVQPALYLRLPALRVWGAARAGAAPEPLDGVFVTRTDDQDAIAALGIFGMHAERAGFSAVAVEGRADEDRASAGELEIAARRGDGSASFAPLLEGGSAAAIHSVADAGEMLLLTCRLLPLLPRQSPGEGGDRGSGGTADRFVERIVVVD